jgi:hypothetical protein
MKLSSSESSSAAVDDYDFDYDGDGSTTLMPHGASVLQNQNVSSTTLEAFSGRRNSDASTKERTKSLLSSVRSSNGSSEATAGEGTNDIDDDIDEDIEFVDDDDGDDDDCCENEELSAFAAAAVNFLGNDSDHGCDSGGGGDDLGQRIRTGDTPSPAPVRTTFFCYCFL